MSVEAGGGEGSRGEGVCLHACTQRGAGPPQVPADLTQGYEAVHDLHQVLAAELLLDWGLGAHLWSSAQGD